MNNKSDRAFWIAIAAGLATWVFALVIAIMTIPAQTPDRERWAVFGLLTLASIAVAAFIGQVGSWLEDELEQRAARAWPRCEPDLRSSNEEPDSLWWFEAVASPRVMLARIRGQLLYRNLLLAVSKFISSDGEYSPFDGFTVFDPDEPFQPVVRCLRGKKDHAPNRWLIIVGDPEKVGEDFSATTSGAPKVTKPAVVAAVVSYKKLRRNWQAKFEEVHLLDAAYVAGCAVGAWERVARERDLEATGLEVTARLDGDGITWNILFHVPTTESDAEDAVYRLDELLGELRTPVRVWAVGALPDDDVEDDAWDGDRAAVHDQQEADGYDTAGNDDK